MYSAAIPSSDRKSFFLELYLELQARIWGLGPELLARFSMYTRTLSSTQSLGQYHHQVS